MTLFGSLAESLPYRVQSSGALCAIRIIVSNEERSLPLRHHKISDLHRGGLQVRIGLVYCTSGRRCGVDFGAAGGRPGACGLVRRS
jgi:hypothetical protein